MTKNFIKELERKGLIPVGECPYVDLVEENPHLYEGLLLHDFYLLTGYVSHFARKQIEHFQIQHKGEPIDTPEKFRRLYFGSKQKLAQLVDDERFHGGLKPLELFLVFEYFNLQRLGNFSGNLAILDRYGGRYPYVQFLWECGLADYANQVEDEQIKNRVLGCQAKFDIGGEDLAEIVLTSEKNLLPMKNSLQFQHAHSREGNIREDDVMFNQLGIPQVYLDYLRENFENVPMKCANWNGNARLFGKVSGLLNYFYSYSERFKDFLNQFDSFKWV